MSDENRDEGESVEESSLFPSHVSMTMTQAAPDPTGQDVMLRLNIITCLHNVGYDVYEAEAVNSLKHTYPQFFS